MMKPAIYLPLLFAAVACATSGPMVGAKYTPRNAPESAKPARYTLQVPKGYRLQTLIGGHNELEQHFVYPDSAVVYISDFAAGSIVNYNNIVALGPEVASRRFQSQKLQASINAELGLPFRSDTLVLEGTTKAGLRWKDVRLGAISVGYSQVPPAQKLLFDQALASVASK